MKIQKTRKRKLSLKDFSRCRPGATRKTNANATCLPNSVYSDISRRIQVKNRSKLFKEVGCGKGEEHCLLDKAPIDQDTKKTLRNRYLRLS